MRNIPSPYYGQNNEPLSEVHYQERQVENFQIQQSGPTVILPPFTHYPEPCICPYCHQSIVTRIKKRNGVAVWLTSAAICFFGFALGCCLIPFFLDGIKDTTHYCPNCNRVIGRKKRL